MLLHVVQYTHRINVKDVLGVNLGKRPFIEWEGEVIADDKHTVLLELFDDSIELFVYYYTLKNEIELVRLYAIIVDGYLL